MDRRDVYKNAAVWLDQCGDRAEQEATELADWFAKRGEAQCEETWRQISQAISVLRGLPQPLSFLRH